MYVEYKDDNSKHAVNDADVSEFPDSFRNAGWLLTDNDLVVDIDNLPKETIQKMLKTFNINTQTVWTDRGVHLYFKKPATFRGAGAVTPLGFEVEFKHLKNTKSITIKRKGVMRTIENQGVREALPFVLSNSVSKLDSLLGLDEGDGRNQKLYKHKMKLNRNKHTDAILSFINDYIFAEPMDQSEFEQVSRSNDSSSTDEDEHYTKATEIMNIFSTVIYGETLYFKDNDGEFTDDTAILRQHIFRLSGPKKTNFIDEVMKQVEYRSHRIPSDTVFPIRFKNGILQDGEFIPVNYQEFTPYIVDIDYEPDAEPVEEVDQYIKLLTNNDKDYEKLLYEIIGHTLIVNPEFKRLMGKFFIFVGDGGNGKGTLLTIIRSILDRKNVTGLSIRNMADERYFTTMKGKLANLGDDIQDEPINNDQMKLLKNISTCDYVSMRQLYRQSEDVELTCTLIFTSNHILKSFEKGESYKRRVVWLPMYSKPTKKDPKFITKLTTPKALKYWIKLIVDGYMRLYNNVQFTESVAVNKFNQDYHNENDTSGLFLQDFKKEDIEGLRPPEIYEQYEAFCDENGVNVMSRKQFQANIKEDFNLVPKAIKKNGKSMRAYTEAEE
ncbi:DNA primase [Staphylococcus saprophyticus]|uniref:phage/plasmid primase, P4 family n=1 Tax=Staphylococcus saprophyticus TaxID=29385 RepID=UPI0005973002|nr:phage/plasmid primase, P4 family [Staphylococcus saprophyticus]KIJ86837.1 DNA primase [Staphylococcus saprophyticus]